MAQLTVQMAAQQIALLTEQSAAYLIVCRHIFSGAAASMSDGMMISMVADAAQLTA
jgi:hypothetical protein